MSKGKLTLIAAVIAAVAAGSAAYASIPDGAGVIHGCYGKPGSNRPGALRVIDSPSESCAANENPLSWSQQGPKGDKGDPGLPGAKGDKGDPGGITDAYSTYGSGTFIAKDSTSTIAAIALPAGSFTLSGSANLTSAKFNDIFVECSFSTSGGTLHQSPDPSRLYLDGDTPGATMPVLGDITIASGPVVVSLRCTSNLDEAGASGVLIATQVGAVHAQ